MAVSWKSLFTVLLLALFYTPGLPVQENKLSDDKHPALKNGEIVIELKQHPETGVYLPTGQCLVDGTIDEVWRVITDFDGFKEFLPHVIYYRPVCWKAGRLLVDCKVRVAGFGFEYRLAYDINNKNHFTYWSYISGPIRDSQGYWRIELYDNSRVLVTYATTLDAGRAIPGFIERMLSKSTFPDIFKSLKKRVNQLKMQGSIRKPVIITKVCET